MQGMEGQELHLLAKYQVFLDVARGLSGVDGEMMETYMLFLQSASRVFLAQQTFFERFDLSEGKVGLLLLLYRAPEHSLTPSLLAEAASVTRGTVTGLLAGLERAGLVRRMEHPDDGRMVTIELSDAGVALLEQMLPERIERIGRFLSSLTTAEQAQLRFLLAKMADTLPMLNER